MELVAKKLNWGALLPAVLAITLATPLSAQEQVVEYGRIVQADDGTGSLDYLLGEETSLQREEKKAWIPVLSPLMIRLDCWMTRVVNIHTFYSQQAADEYFAMAEYCSDIPLSMDPNIYNNTGLKYTVLSPVYAWCPGLLNRRGILGGAGGYGVPNPFPSVASAPYSGQPMGAPPASMESYSAPPSNQGLQPMPQPEMIEEEIVIEVGSVNAPRNIEPPRSENVTTGGKWSQMSDAEILAHFGLDPSMAARAKQAADMDGSRLEEPVVESDLWQFAEEAPTVSLPREEVVALNGGTTVPQSVMSQPAQPIILEERIIEKPTVTQTSIMQEPEIELEFDETAELEVESKSEFSSTDAEYDRMREIEKELLGF